MGRVRIILSTASAYLDWVITVGLAVVVSVLGLQQDVAAQTVSSATLLILGAFAIGAIRDRAAARKLRKTLEALPASVRFAIADSELVEDSKKTGLVRVYVQTVNYNW